jgi:UDP:flavonoid glycosyltransferase YjiC (YdhE family)
MTFGTVLGHMMIADEVYGAALEAVSDLEARVLLTVGRRFDPASLGVAPANVHVESWVDQNTVFDQADVVVCHGGSGTTFGALRAGVPVVVVPLFADQDFNGVKVAESGTGIVVDLHRQEARRSPFGRDDANLVAEATRAILSDPKYRQHARSIAQEMALAPTTTDLLRTLLDPTRTP